MKLLTIVCCKNFLSLQILQAAATGKLPMQRENSDVVGISETGIENWDWVIASEFINMLVYVALYGETSEIQRSAIQAGEMVSVRVDSAPVQGYGLLDLVHLNTQGVLGPAVQYALQQGLSRLYIHVKNDPLRKSGAHLIWKSLQKMGGCPGHRVIVGIGQNKTKCWESVKSQLGQNRKLLFEQMFDTLSEHYIPQSVSIATTASSKPRQTKGKSPTISEPDIVKPDIPVAPTASKISVVSSSTPGSVLLFMNSSKTFPAPSTESYCARNDRYLKDIVADQWYKELLSVFRATEKAHQSILECEELSEAEKNHAQEFVEELDLTESEVCNVMDSLVVGH